MTISTLANQNTFYGNGSTTVFDFNFIADEASDLQVILTNSSGVQTTLIPSSYLIALNPIAPGFLWSTGGTLTYPLSGPPLASGNSLTVSRILPFTQEADISNQGNFYPEVVEQALDVLCMEIQQLSARTGQLRGTWITDTLYNFGDIVVDGANGANTGNLYVCAIANTSGTWSTDLGNGDWSLALNVQAIVQTLPTISNNQLLANISGITETPYGVALSALIDSAISNVQGSLLYRSGSSWVALSPGTNGQVLQTQGASANPHWVAGSGSGTVTSVGSGTGLTGGPITGSGTLSLATIANNSLLANITGSTGSPSATTLSALLDAILSNVQGSIIYRGPTSWAALGPGSAGQILESGGAAANPQWSSAGGSGTLTAGAQLIINPYSQTNTSTAHGLGAIPAILDVRIVCLTAELGYSVGDSVLVGGSNVSSANASFAIAADSTFVYFSGASPVEIVNKTLASSAPITEANWQLVATPYKVN